jgi:hypothetical protein
MQPQVRGKAIIITGGQASFLVRLRNAITGDPYDLTTVYDIKTCFLNADGTELMLGIQAPNSGITIVGAAIGKIQIALTALQTSLLLPIRGQALDISIYPTNATPVEPIPVRIYDAYSVLLSEC